MRPLFPFLTFALLVLGSAATPDSDASSRAVELPRAWRVAGSAGMTRGSTAGHPSHVAFSSSTIEEKNADLRSP